jgi:hypothetical protein
MRTKRTEIPLSTKVEQLLTEAVSSSRVSIVRLSVDRDADERLRPIAALGENDAYVRNPTDSKALELRPANSNSRDGRRLREHFRFGK